MLSPRWSAWRSWTSWFDLVTYHQTLGFVGCSSIIILSAEWHIINLFAQSLSQNCPFRHWLSSVVLYVKLSHPWLNIKIRQRKQGRNCYRIYPLCSEDRGCSRFLSFVSGPGSSTGSSRISLRPSRVFGYRWSWRWRAKRGRGLLS